ncbi:MAG: glycine/sarcosine/betaine reductase selenoprotein B family protein [Gemmatimonadaceae bacterium]
MASFSDLPFAYRQAIRVYPWRRIDPVPWTPLQVPIARARLALITSAGLYRSAIDAPFKKSAGGDVSFRLLPSDVPLQSLVVGQPSDAFDHAPIEADRNVGLPLDRVRELVAGGEVGSLAPRVISFNGSILAPRRLVVETGPAVADALRADAVDAALFVPV